MQARIELQIPGQVSIAFGPEDGTRTAVSGPVQQLAGWMTGRSADPYLTAPGGLPKLPPWI